MYNQRRRRDNVERDCYRSSSTASTATSGTTAWAYLYWILTALNTYGISSNDTFPASRIQLECHCTRRPSRWWKAGLSYRHTTVPCFNLTGVVPQPHGQVHSRYQLSLLLFIRLHALCLMCSITWTSEFICHFCFTFIHIDADFLSLSLALFILSLRQCTVFRDIHF